MPTQTLLTNAHLVLPDAVLHASLSVRDGRIEAIDPALSHLPGAIDCEGDFILPGLIDLHTDNLERQVQPRSNARWPSLSALLAHDAHCAAAGITTVFDALCVGDIGFERGRAETCDNAVADLAGLAVGPGEAAILKSDHRLHLRCELPAPCLLDQLDRYADNSLLGMVSLMDHTPGFGQYADLDLFRRVRRPQCTTDAELEAQIVALRDQRDRLREPNRAGLLARLAGRSVPIASHDDRTEAEIADNARHGVSIAEFPVSAVAAHAARAAGLGIIAGAPNLVRGGSHSGNVAAATLLAAGLVDALASDYVPSALIEAAFAAARATSADLLAALPGAIGLVTANPARMAGLADRGALRAGLRADLVRVRLHRGLPVIRGVWSAGARVC